MHKCAYVRVCMCVCVCVCACVHVCVHCVRMRAYVNVSVDRVSVVGLSLQTEEWTRIFRVNPHPGILTV